MIRTVYWKDGAIQLIDQTLLPGRFEEIRIETLEALWEAIRALRVRGAPAIGIAAAYGAALAAQQYEGKAVEACLDRVREACQYLATSRPTAVNLFWALERMKRCAEAHASLAIEGLKERLLAEAEAILEEDIRLGRRLGSHGADLLKDGDVVLTHCNAGGLATGGYGTALGVIYAAKEQGKRIRVFADETRPLLQGARLTTWELMQNGIDVTLICDSMAASVMRDQGVKAVLVGADRIAGNGDVANKIGTYSLAVLAQAHGIAFYAAAPWSTLDLSLASGGDIPIEIREESEVRCLSAACPTAPPDVPVFNPAFDVTPAALVTAIITERGIARPPFEQALREMDERNASI